MLPLSSPPKKGFKNAKRLFSIKIAHRLKKVCYKVSLCENRQRESCNAFIGLTIRACKNDWWRQPLLPEILGQTTALKRNRRFSIYFRPQHLSRNTWRKSSINTNRKSTRAFNEPKMNIVRCP